MDRTISSHEEPPVRTKQDDSPPAADITSGWEAIDIPETDRFPVPSNPTPGQPHPESKDNKSENPSLTQINLLDEAPPPPSPIQHLITNLGFHPSETPSTLPESLVSALHNRFSTAYLTASQARAQQSTNPLNTLPIFVLGAFIFPAVLSRTVDDNTSRHDAAKLMTPAILRGYNRHAVRDASFPAAFPSSDAGSQVQGMVVFVPEGNEGWRERMDRFQNGMYALQRGMAEVVSEEGDVVVHEVVLYVWNGASSRLVPVVGGGGEGGGERQWCASKMMRGDWLGRVHRAWGELKPCMGMDDSDMLAKNYVKGEV